MEDTGSIAAQDRRARLTLYATAKFVAFGLNPRGRVPNTLQPEDFAARAEEAYLRGKIRPPDERLLLNYMCHHICLDIQKELGKHRDRANAQLPNEPRYPAGVTRTATARCALAQFQEYVRRSDADNGQALLAVLAALYAEPNMSTLKLANTLGITRYRALKFRRMIQDAYTEFFSG